MLLSFGNILSDRICGSLLASSSMCCARTSAPKLCEQLFPAHRCHLVFPLAPSLLCCLFTAQELKVAQTEVMQPEVMNFIAPKAQTMVWAQVTWLVQEQLSMLKNRPTNPLAGVSSGSASSSGTASCWSTSMMELR